MMDVKHPSPRGLLAALVIGVVVSVSPAQPGTARDAGVVRALEDGVVEVIAWGVAVNDQNAEENAVEDARRRAVEEGAGVRISAESIVEDFALVRDVIITKAAGYIRRDEILEQGPDENGDWAVKIRAEVAQGEIESDIDALELLVTRVGRPTVMILPDPGSADLPQGVVDEVSRWLAERHIDLKDATMTEYHAMLREIDEDVPSHAVDRRAIDLARLRDASIVMFLSLEAESPQLKPVLRSTPRFKKWSATAYASIRAVATGTGDILAPSERHKGTAVHVATELEASVESTREAILAAMVDMHEQIVDHWSSDAIDREREVELRLERVGFGEARSVERMLGELKGVRDVNLDTFRRGVATIRVYGLLDGEAVAIAIDEFTELEIVAQDRGSVEAQKLNED